MENNSPAVQTKIKDHFPLSIVAIILSCLGGFITIPLAIAALIFSFRTKDLLRNGQMEEAADMSRWAAVFGWITVGIALIPIVLVILFGGTILALLGAALAA